MVEMLSQPLNLLTDANRHLARMNVTAPTAPSAASSRSRMIAERRRNSPVWQAIHLAGSLWVALILLATIAIACAVATFAEANFNTRIAQAYIYKSPWFLLWLAVLCVNLFAVTLTRWPWQKKHIGFVVTHYGIITLLAGAVIGMVTGFEGNVTLQKDGPPATRVVTNRSIVSVESPADEAFYIMPFDAESTRPSARRPRNFTVPGTALKIVADDFSANMVAQSHLTPSSSPSAAPAVVLKLTSAMMGQTIDIPLSLAPDHPAEQDLFGLAHIAFHEQLSPETPADYEVRIVFAKFPPVIPPGHEPAAVEVRLSADGETVSVAEPNREPAAFERKKIMDRPIKGQNVEVIVDKYWPDFVMENGQPISKSANPDNPAILVRARTLGGGPKARPSLEVAPGPDGIAYQLRRGSAVVISGSAAVGGSFALGWADWQALVEQALPKAEVEETMVPGPPLAKGAQGIPGFRAHLLFPDGKSGPSQWIASGEHVTFDAGDGKKVRFAYGLQPRPLPFSMRLVKFEVPRDEGTDTPSNFLATIEFTDPKTGRTKTGVARMNHPASFPGTFWANLTGINYKFSQAEWNPTNLDQTTLQVLYDPGWMLKWIGSLGICIGIAIMFYWKPSGR